MAIDEQNIKVENDAITEGQGVKVENDAITEGQGVKVENSFNIEIKAPVDDELSIDSENPVQNKVITEELMNKQEKLPSKVGQAGKVLKVSQDETKEEWGEPTLPESPTFKQVTIEDYVDNGSGIYFDATGQTLGIGEDDSLYWEGVLAAYRFKHQHGGEYVDIMDGGVYISNDNAVVPNIILSTGLLGDESGLYDSNDNIIAAMLVNEASGEREFIYGASALKIKDDDSGKPVVAIDNHLFLGAVTKLNDYGLFNENDAIIAGYDASEDVFKFANGAISLASETTIQNLTTEDAKIVLWDDGLINIHASCINFISDGNTVASLEYYETLDTGYFRLEVPLVLNRKETSQRPLFAPEHVNIMIGAMIFDTTLKKPIWWDGTKWIDAMGNNVGSGSSYDIEIDGGTF